MPTSAPLGGIGIFHLMNDRAMRARGLPGNHCILVLELEGRLDLNSLDRRIQRAAQALPELRYTLKHDWLRLQSRWAVDPSRKIPRPALYTNQDGLIESLLAQRLDGDHPWAIDAVRGNEHDTLVFRWFHPFTDGKGAERLVAYLGSGTGDTPDPPPPDAERFAASSRPLEQLDDKTRVALMRAYGNHALALGQTPIMSLATIAKSNKTTGKKPQFRFVRTILSETETKHFDSRVRKIAKLAETNFLILCTCRVLDRALVARGFAPAQHIIPLPVSLDPKAGAKRLLGNNITMVLLSLSRSDLENTAAALAHLAEQQRTIVREKLDIGMLAALEFAAKLPSPVYSFLFDRPFRGEMASLVCTNPGHIHIPSFAGQRVLDAYLMPAPVLPPGFQAVFTRFQGRLSAIIAYADTVLSRQEATRMAADLKRELCA